jgi:hypothetical protein
MPTARARGREETPCGTPPMPPMPPPRVTCPFTRPPGTPRDPSPTTWAAPLCTPAPTRHHHTPPRNPMGPHRTPPDPTSCRSSASPHAAPLRTLCVPSAHPLQVMGVGRPMHVASRGTSAKNCIHPGCTKGAIGKLRLCIGAHSRPSTPSSTHAPFPPPPMHPPHPRTHDAHAACAYGVCRLCVCLPHVGVQRTAAASGAQCRDATRRRRARNPSARPTAAGGGANLTAAPARRATAPTCALGTAAASVASTWVARRRRAQGPCTARCMMASSRSRSDLT